MRRDYLGKRFKEIRTDIFDESQEYFCEKINEHILASYGKRLFKHLHFTQPLISSFEKDSKLIFKKYNVLINYLYIKKNINPAWLILENNNNHPKFLKRLEIDKNIAELVMNVDEKFNSISNDLNAIRIVVDNSVFSK